MNPKITAALVVLFLALGSYVYFFAGPEMPDKQIANTLYGQNYGEFDIVELKIRGSDRTAHFIRTDDSLTQDWKSLAPVTLGPTELDQVPINGAATRLGNLTANQVITGVTHLAQYGLDPPELTVTLTISNGEKILLRAGHPTPIRDNRYVLLNDDQQTVYLVMGFAIEALYRLLNTPLQGPTSQP